MNGAGVVAAIAAAALLVPQTRRRLVSVAVVAGRAGIGFAGVAASAVNDGVRAAVTGAVPDHGVQGGQG